MEFPFNLTQAETAWTAAAAAGAVFLIWVARVKTILGLLRKIYGGTILLLTFPAVMQRRMDDQDSKLQTITKELTPNGGGSIKDMIGQIKELGQVNALRTRQMIMTHTVAIYECEPIHGHCITANKALCELFGIPEGSMLGTGWIKGITAKDRQTCWDAYQKAIASDIPYDWSYEVENQRTHERFQCRTEMTVLRDAQGRAILYQGIVEKIPTPPNP